MDGCATVQCARVTGRCCGADATSRACADDAQGTHEAGLHEEPAEEVFAHAGGSADRNVSCDAALCAAAVHVVGDVRRCTSMRLVLFHVALRRCRQRHVPKYIINTKKRQRVVEDSKRRKEDNVRKHSKPGSFSKPPEKKRHIVAETE